MAKNIKKYISISICVILIAFVVISSIVKITYLENEFYNNFISRIIQNLCAFFIVLIFAKFLNIKLFLHIKWSYFFILCLIIAINNMQWFSFFSGKMEVVHSGFIDYLLFAIYCLSIGLFEEVIFRGIVFNELLYLFPKTKKGLTYACLVSSAIFGIMHIFNGFSASTLLQVLYSTLTGCLFVYCYIKTQNIIFPIIIHSVYNFCGMLFSVNGLGSGVVFDLGTIITMAIVDVCLAICILVDFIKSDNLLK